MAASLKVTASPADVRVWAADNGFTVGKRGKFSRDLISAYNKANGLKYREGEHVPTVKVTAKPAKGRSVTRTVNMAQVRAAAVEAGVEVGKRGRIDRKVIDAYVLGTLSDLA